VVLIAPEEHRGHQVIAFVQDEIAIVPSRLTFTGGAKISDSDLSSTTVRPNVRLAWTPAAHTTVWTAFSGADRIPTRYTLDGALTIVAPDVVPGMRTLLHVQGTRELRSESLHAYEAGYRVRLGSRAVIDAAAFVNEYDDLVGYSTPVPSVQFAPVPHMLLSSAFENQGRSTARGAEVVAQVRLAGLHLDGSYTFLDSDPLGWLAPDPRHSGSIGATFSPGSGWEAGARLFAATEIVPTSPVTRLVPSYERLDLRLSRTIGPATVSVVGQNLTRASHSESDGTLGTVLPVPRSAYARIDWRF
jgi:hypothetical protein